MPKIRLTDLGLRSLPIPQKGQVDYWDITLPTFGCRVSQGGSKTFVINIRDSRRSIGLHGILSLAEARTEAKRLLAEHTLGKVRPQSLTYEQATKLYLDEKAHSRRSRTVKDYKRLLAQI